MDKKAGRRSQSPGAPSEKNWLVEEEEEELAFL